MFKSRKFWIPFGTALAINALWILRMLAGIGTHEKSTPESNTIIRMVFPYFELLGPVAPLLGLSTIILQIPVYGFIIGWACAKGKLGITALVLLIVHSIVYMIGTFLSENG